MRTRCPPLRPSGESEGLLDFLFLGQGCGHSGERLGEHAPPLWDDNGSPLETTGSVKS